MGKRSDFPRKPRDLYPTPPQALAPLLGHLPPQTMFIEPCAGNGALIDGLIKAGHSMFDAWDIDPGRDDIIEQDALEGWVDGAVDCFITNPPWNRKILHPLIMHLSDQWPTWLLIDADWAHTKQAAPFLDRCTDIVSVGRVKWIPESPHTGKDNCAWYRFERWPDKPTTFFGRT